MLLITGASGRVARRTATLLQQQGVPLRLMTRSTDRVPPLPGTQVMHADFSMPETLDAAFAGISTALIVSGSGKPGQRSQLHHNAFEAAARAHVQHIVYLSLQGASPQSKYPYSRDHYASEQYLAATGVPFTVLRNGFYLDMFLEKFDETGTMRGPAADGSGAFISREDAARTAAAVLINPPGGLHDVTGPQVLSLTEITRRLSALTGRELRYEPESVASARQRLSQQKKEPWRVDLSVEWFEAIAAGELSHTSDAVLRYTGKPPLTLEQYFAEFPALLQPLKFKAS
ncbi:MAG TPA: SDR family oxidoreductase [Acidobacteriaceae bacterium]